MLRLAIDLVVGINALGVIVGFTIRRVRQSRRNRVDEHIERLEAENRQLDRMYEKIEGGRR